MKDLAFCIPAYNRKECLIELLETIVDQVDDSNRHRVQICVSDDCSPNSLKDTVSYMKKYNIEYIYYRNQINLGADRNFLKSAEIATARYCWMMGDDDGISAGSLELMLNYIDNHPEVNVFFANRYVCNRKLKLFMVEKWTKTKVDYSVDFTKEKEIKQYFDQLNTTTCLGYLTTLVVKKSEWDAITPEQYEPYIGTIYIQVAKYLMMLYHKDSLYRINKCIALSRFGNDNFFNSLKQRIFMDYYGFLKLSEIFDDNVILKDCFLCIVRRHYNNLFLNAMSFTAVLNESEITILKKIGYSPKQIRIFEHRNRIKSGLFLLGNIVKSMFTDFSWFYKTVFVVIQKLKR